MSAINNNNNNDNNNNNNNNNNNHNHNHKVKNGKKSSIFVHTVKVIFSLNEKNTPRYINIKLKVIRSIRRILAMCNIYERAFLRK